MTDWFRSWHGAPSDPKWRMIARRASVRPGEVWSVISYLWDRASQASDRGSIAGYDCELIAEVFGYEPEEVERIVGALIDKGVVVDDRIAAWDKYQPRREDGSAERAKAWREQKKTQPNATERNRPTEKIQSREDTEPSSLRSDGDGRARRATRLSSDWTLPDDWRQDGVEAGLTEAEIDREWPIMRDWSLSKPDGARKDWRAMWRNWCKRKATERPTARGSPPQRSNPLSDAFGLMRGHDDRPTEPVSDSVRYLPAASR